MFKKEVGLQGYVERFSKREWFRGVSKQVRFYDRSIDVMGLTTKGQRVVSVECKLTKWRYALNQAMIYQLCSDWVYVALPEVKINCVDKSLFRKNGVGLLGVSQSGMTNVVVKPSQSKVVRGDYKKAYSKFLMSKVPV